MLVLQIRCFIFTAGGLQGALVGQGINQTGLAGSSLLSGQQIGTGLFNFDACWSYIGTNLSKSHIIGITRKALAILMCVCMCLCTKQ